MKLYPRSIEQKPANFSCTEVHAIVYGMKHQENDKPNIRINLNLCTTDGKIAFVARRLMDLIFITYVKKITH